MCVCDYGRIELELLNRGGALNGPCYSAIKGPGLNSTSTSGSCTFDIPLVHISTKSSSGSHFYRCYFYLSSILTWRISTKHRHSICQPQFVFVGGI